MVRVLLNDPAQEGRKVMNKLLLALMYATLILAGCSSSVAHYHDGIERFSLHSSRGIGTSSVVINTNDQKYPRYVAEIGLPGAEGEVLARQMVYTDLTRRNHDVLYGGDGYDGYRFNGYGYGQPSLQCQTHLNRCYMYYDRITGIMRTAPPGWGPQPTYTAFPLAR